MPPRKRIVIYVDVEPYPSEEYEIRHPEHALVEGTIDAMKTFTNLMTRPIENMSKALKYFLKTVIPSD